MSFCIYAVPLILIEKGFNYSSLSLLASSAIFYTLKIFYAPLLDAYYFKNFG